MTLPEDAHNIHKATRFLFYLKKQKTKRANTKHPVIFQVPLDNSRITFILVNTFGGEMC